MSARIGFQATTKRPGYRFLWHRRRLGKGEADRSGNCGELRNAEADGIAQIEPGQRPPTQLIMQVPDAVSWLAVGDAHYILHIL